jgi:hypothetical protein
VAGRVKLSFQVGAARALETLVGGESATCAR